MIKQFLTFFLIINVYISIQVKQELGLSKEFMEFSLQFQKQYESIEEMLQRSMIFENNLQKLKEHQKKHSNAQFGFIEQMDQIFSKSRGYVSENNDQNYFNQLLEINTPIQSDLPLLFDYRTQGNVVGKIRNQTECESCWAFSSIQNIESQIYLKYNLTLYLSPQQLVDCDWYDHRCRGGTIQTAYQYMIENQGLNSAKDYPYNVSDNMNCLYDDSKIVAKLSSFEIIPQNETIMAHKLMEKGPLSVAINSEHLEFYQGGIISAAECPPKPDHAVLIVGFGTENGTDYWILKNQWGEKWGEKGFFRIERGQNACGIQSDVTVVTGVDLIQKPKSFLELLDI